MGQGWIKAIDFGGVPEAMPCYLNALALPEIAPIKRRSSYRQSSKMSLFVLMPCQCLGWKSRSRTEAYVSVATINPQLVLFAI